MGLGHKAVTVSDPYGNHVVDHVEDEDEDEVDHRRSDRYEQAGVVPDAVHGDDHGHAVDDDGDKEDGGNSDKHEDGRPREDYAGEFHLPERGDRLLLLRDEVLCPTHHV